MLTVSFSANFIDYHYHFIGNVSGYSILTCIAMLSIDYYNFYQKACLIALLGMNILGLICHFTNTNYSYWYEVIIIACVIVASLIKLGNLADELD
ncbi:hypothetical protein [Abyssalbus ytuae]|uniref:Uncharacterized protein n=1 Tax=Abyssalbus ytuae TaxID=2926907 RepID=A0A9E6ZWQ6_9FLAO|nr:hypothetical protein [Abyssalbus ytuae]UOB16597.1 hypothetical protein MQE35_12730 [Abyssalbus ytuae]